MPTPTVGFASAVRISDGRRLTFLTAGPEDGFPVVYCHGAIGSPRWRVSGLESVLERLGVRYLVVNRPGFGGSDPCPGRSVAGFGQDLGEVLDELGHERFSVIGVSAGAPYALACGWALPDRVTALAAVSPLGPPAGPGASPSLRYRIPMIPYGAAGVGPAFASLSLRALRLHGQTSARAMIDDYLVCRQPWGFDPAELRVPVNLWHGGSDRLVPLAHGLALAGVIPGCTTFVEPAGGHFFYSHRLDEIIRSLVAAPAPAPASPAEPDALPLLRAA